MQNNNQEPANFDSESFELLRQKLNNIPIHVLEQLQNFSPANAVIKSKDPHVKYAHFSTGSPDLSETNSIMSSLCQDCTANFQTSTAKMCVECVEKSTKIQQGNEDYNIQEWLVELEQYLPRISKGQSSVDNNLNSDSEESDLAQDPLDAQEEINIKISHNPSTWKYQTKFTKQTEPKTTRITQNIDDLKLVEELKLKGNELFKNGKYGQAANKYTEAIELGSDVIVLWINRALAFLKLEKYLEAAEDCSEVINRYQHTKETNPESYFKAYLRRACANKYLKRFDEALLDINNALLICPKDKEAICLKSEIEDLMLSSPQGKTLTVDEATVELIDKFTHNQPPQDLLQVLKLLKGNQDDTKEYFYQMSSVVQVLKIVEIEDQVHNEENLISTLPALVLQVYLDGNQLYQEDFIKEKKGLDIVLTKIRYLLRKAEGKQRSAIYDAVQDYLEVLCLMEDDKIRICLLKNSVISKAMYPELFSRICPLHKTEKGLVIAYLTLCNNLCYCQSPLKKELIEQHSVVIGGMLDILDSIQLNSTVYQNIVNVVCNLLANLLVENTFKQRMLAKENRVFLAKLIQLLGTSLDADCLMGVFVNLTHGIELNSIQYLISLKLLPALVDRLRSGNGIVIERCLIVISRTQYSQNIYIVTQFLKEYPIAMDLLIQMLRSAPRDSLQHQLLKSSELFKLLHEFRELLQSDLEEVFCTTCVALQLILNLSPLKPQYLGNNPCSYFQQTIQHLLNIVRDHRNTKIVKSAAQLLCELTKDEKNMHTIRDLRGTEILQSSLGYLNYT